MSKLKKALQKASENRAFEGEGQQNIQKEIRREGFDVKKSKVDNDKNEINICYSETKVKKIKETILKKGKVISHFPDVENVDQIKTLRTRILDYLKTINGNSFLVTSANPSEGKTFTAINLGVSIAQELKHTVLIVDGDLRKPTKYHKNFSMDFFGIEVEKGLSDYLLKKSEIHEILINPGIERLVVLPSGKAVPNSAELLSSPRMEKLAEDIKNRYPTDRIIIFDGSAILASADPLILSRYVDGILLVVEEKRTTIEDIKKTVEMLEDKPLFGTIINKAK